MIEFVKCCEDNETARVYYKLGVDKSNNKFFPDNPLFFDNENDSIGDYNYVRFLIIYDDSIISYFQDYYDYNVANSPTIRSYYRGVDNYIYYDEIVKLTGNITINKTDYLLGDLDNILLFQSHPLYSTEIFMAGKTVQVKASDEMVLLVQDTVELEHCTIYRTTEF